MKVVYSPNIGGLDVSVEQVRRGRTASGNPLWGGACLLGDRDPRWPDKALDYESTACVGYDVERWDPVLVVLAEEPDSGMTVIDIPAGTRFRIRENEETGQEWIEYPEDIKWQVAK